MADVPYEWSKQGTVAASPYYNSARQKARNCDRSDLESCCRGSLSARFVSVRSVSLPLMTGSSKCNRTTGRPNFHLRIVCPTIIQGTDIFYIVGSTGMAEIVTKIESSRLLRFI